MFNDFLRATGSRDLAEDLFQALFLRVFRAGSRYEPHQPFRVWLFSLARNLLRDRWRQLKRAPEWRSTTRHSPGFGERRCSAGSPPGRAPGTTGGPRQAHLEGFDLHANVAVRAGERARLENLCRYVLRPPVAQDALELTPEGTMVLRLRRPWRDGTRAIRFEPSELLEKLAAMIPRPRANLLLYHRAFAPRGCCRESTDPWSSEGIERRTPESDAAVPSGEPE